MVERRQIVQHWRNRSAKVLATVIRVEGSSYRRPGAHLLLAADGTHSGTISGGCLEAEVARKAAWMVRDGPLVERYSTLFDDTADIPYGLGCGGIVDLLLEPANTPECRAFLEAMASSLVGIPSLVATWLPEYRQPLARAVLSPSSEVIFASPTLSAYEIASISVTNINAQPVSADWQGAPTRDGIQDSPTDRDSRIYIEHLFPPQRLFVLGAGDDAKPVVSMAALLGWNVTVADGRSHLARPDRFPEASRVLTSSSIATLGIQPADAIVLMTHSYEQDRALLTGLLSVCPAPPSPLAAPAIYIGLLGARHRSSLLLSEAAAQLNLSLAECCARVYAPVGLDLGGDGPEAVALAVIAEVQAWLQGRLGRSRRLTPDDIAQQVSQAGASRYLQTQCALADPSLHLADQPRTDRPRS
jgi:xanthine/CO dehydrogenase XdhC/CoxF family maturation factor